MNEESARQSCAFGPQIESSVEFMLEGLEKCSSVELWSVEMEEV